jgi:hypothetical protein
VQGIDKSKPLKGCGFNTRRRVKLLFLKHTVTQPPYSLKVIHFHLFPIFELGSDGKAQTKLGVLEVFVSKSTSCCLFLVTIKPANQESAGLSCQLAQASIRQGGNRLAQVSGRQRGSCCPLWVFDFVLAVYGQRFKKLSGHKEPISLRDSKASSCPLIEAFSFLCDEPLESNNSSVLRLHTLHR